MGKNFLAVCALMVSLGLAGCKEAPNKSTSSVSGENVSLGQFGMRIEGSSNYISREFQVKDFDKVVVTGPMDVDFSQQEGKRAVQVNTSDNLIDLIDIHIKSRTLYIGMKKSVSISFKRMMVRVIGGPIESMTLAGSGDLTMKSGLRAPSFDLSLLGSGDVEMVGLDCPQGFTLTLSGSGDVNLHGVTTRGMTTTLAGSGDIEAKGVKAEAVTATVAGSGDITLEGQTKSGTYVVAGSGDINAENLFADNVESSVSGSGDITCHALKSLQANRNGSGSIGYKGNPSQVSKTKGVRRL